MAKPVEAVALAAFRKREEERKARDYESEQRYKAEQAEKDAACMAEVVKPSPLTDWFPGVEWVLVDRKQGATTAIVHPSGSPDLFLRVRLSRDPRPAFGVYVTVRASHPSATPWRDVRRISDPADLGEYLHRLSQPRETEASADD
ncbi:MAG: hypothetical protein WB777_14335 [Mycobacterium sp.]